MRNLPGYLVLRLLCGLAGSPAISTVGVSLSDTWGPLRAPRAIAIWGSFATAGPVMGPLIGAAASVRYETWRAPLYILACVAAFTIVLMCVWCHMRHADAAGSSRCQKRARMRFVRRS